MKIPKITENEKLAGVMALGIILSNVIPALGIRLVFDLVLLGGAVYFLSCDRPGEGAEVPERMKPPGHKPRRPMPPSGED